MQELQEEIEGLQSKVNALTEERQTLLQAHEGSTGAVQALQAEIEQHEESLRRAQAAAEAASEQHRSALSAAQEDLQKGASDWADEVGPVIYLRAFAASDPPHHLSEPFLDRGSRNLSQATAIDLLMSPTHHSPCCLRSCSVGVRNHKGAAIVP